MHRPWPLVLVWKPCLFCYMCCWHARVTRNREEELIKVMSSKNKIFCGTFPQTHIYIYIYMSCVFVAHLHHFVEHLRSGKPVKEAVAICGTNICRILSFIYIYILCLWSFKISSVSIRIHNGLWHLRQFYLSAHG